MSTSITLKELEQVLPRLSQLEYNEIKHIVMDYFLNETHLTPEHYMREIVQEITNRDPTSQELYIASNIDTTIRRYYSLLDSYLIELVLSVGFDVEDLESNDLIETFELDTSIKLEPKSFWVTLVVKMIRQLCIDMNR
jgi:hypothetical protein